MGRAQRLARAELEGSRRGGTAGRPSLPAVARAAADGRRTAPGVPAAGSDRAERRLRRGSGRSRSWVVAAGIDPPQLRRGEGTTAATGSIPAGTAGPLG